MEKRKKALKKDIRNKMKRSFAQHNLPMATGTYMQKLKSIIPEGFAKDGRAASFDEEPGEHSRKSTYFSFSRFDPEYKNSYFENPALLEKRIGKAFGINPDMDFFIIENNPDGLEFCITLEFDEIVGGKKVPALHSILYVTGNLNGARPENAQQEAVRALT